MNFDSIDQSFIWIVIAGVFFAALIAVAKIVFWVFIIREGFKHYRKQLSAAHQDIGQLQQLAHQSANNAQWQGLLQAAREMEAAMRSRAGKTGGNPQVLSTSFGTAWAKAQNELNHLDRIGRERADLYLSDIKSQAASMNLYL